MKSYHTVISYASAMMRTLKGPLMVIQDSKIRGLFTFAYFCHASAEARYVLAAAMVKPLQVTGIVPMAKSAILVI